MISWESSSYNSNFELFRFIFNTLRCTVLVLFFILKYIYLYQESSVEEKKKNTLATFEKKKSINLRDKRKSYFLAIEFLRHYFHFLSHSEEVGNDSKSVSKSNLQTLRAIRQNGDTKKEDVRRQRWKYFKYFPVPYPRTKLLVVHGLSRKSNVSLENQVLYCSIKIERNKVNWGREGNSFSKWG